MTKGKNNGAPPPPSMSVPNERGEVCVAGAYLFFKHLRNVERELESRSPHWENIEADAEMMEESLPLLAACDPKLPVGDLKKLVANLKAGARYGIRPAIRRTVWDIEDVFERAYKAQLERVRQPYKERILERLRSER
jgi:hypothetical protein